ncbi:MAG TPA: NAD-binding protein [Desulfosalsimonadaceae bacterium]|nr:NAD-binding protein [Desulfosalsimonadaceae bacterium]
MYSPRFIITAIMLLLLFLVGGSTGYMVIEGYNFMDALYMTVITISTVGYEEVQPLGEAGRIFSMALIISGVAFFLYIAAFMVQTMLEGQIRIILGRRTLEKKINRLRNHYIVCGYGRIGRVLCKNVQDYPDMELVAIESNSEIIPTMEQDGVLYICGDASEEDNLLKAGIKRAKGLVAALATDTNNVFLVLTARQLNPDIMIIARASNQGAKTKLLAAGASRVESPYDIGAVSMAQRLMRPSVSSFLDLVFTYNRKDIQMEEIPVDPASSLAELMLKDSGIRQTYNLIIIAMIKPDGGMLFNPSHNTLIQAGDTVIAMGESENLEKLATVLRAGKKNNAMG